MSENLWNLYYFYSLIYATFLHNILKKAVAVDNVTKYFTSIYKWQKKHLMLRLRLRLLSYCLG